MAGTDQGVFIIGAEAGGEQAVVGPIGHQELELVAETSSDEKAEQAAFLTIVRACGIVGWTIGHSSAEDTVSVGAVAGDTLPPRVHPAYMRSDWAAIAPYIIVVVKVVECFG